MNQPPLNPDAVDRVAKALMDDAGYTWGNATEKFRDGFRHHARIALAAALPEVTSEYLAGAWEAGYKARKLEEQAEYEQIAFGSEKEPFPEILRIPNPYLPEGN